LNVNVLIYATRTRKVQNAEFLLKKQQILVIVESTENHISKKIL